jgi:CheY-like chemotaxis protein
VPRILLVEDDKFFAQSCRSVFEDAGFEVLHTKDASAGLLAFKAEPDSFAAIVIDMAMPSGPRFSQLEARSGFHAGLALSRSILRLKYDARLIGLTGFPDDQIIRWFKSKRLPLLFKHNTTPKQLLDHLTLASPSGPSALRMCFIVHGHDASAVNELKTFVEERLNGYVPVILAESRSGGLTVIEKFEEYSEAAFIAFVLMTPDDQVLDGTGRTIARRARQNVIFELGYFLGRMGRSNGRVLILTKGDVEIPSDIAGIVRIDISSGVSGSASEILRELETW